MVSQSRMFLNIIFSSSLISSTFSKLKETLFCKAFTKFSLSFSVASPPSTSSSYFGHFFSVFLFIMLFLITFISSSVSHPFILIILDWSHNLCFVTFRLCLSFRILHFHFLYPLIGFPSSTNCLVKK